MSGAEKKGHFDCFVLDALERTPYINGQLAHLRHSLFVYEIYVLFRRLVEDNAHHCLSSAYWTVGLSVDFIRAH